jgi:hypothetical protein
VGFDERTATQQKAMVAAMNSQLLGDAAVSASVARDQYRFMRDKGYDVGSPATTDEIYADERQGQERFHTQFKAATVARGGYKASTPERQKELDRLMKKFADEGTPERLAELRAQGMSVEDSRMGIENEIRALIEEDNGGRTSFDNLMDKRSFKAYTERARTNYDANEDIVKWTRQGRNNALAFGNVSEALMDRGAVANKEDASAVINSIVNNLGAKGLVEMDAASKDAELAKKGPEAVKARQMQILKNAGLTGASADQLYGTFFDEKGGVKNKDLMGFVVEEIGMNNYTPALDEASQQDLAQRRLDSLGKSSKGVRLRGEDTRVSLNSIMTSLFSGQAKGIQDQESMALSIQALAASGAGVPLLEAKDANGETIYEKDASGKAVKKMIDLEKSSAVVDFSQGISDDGLKALEKVHGKDLGIEKKFGMTREDLIARTKTDSKLRERVISTLQNDEEYAGLNLSGTVEQMTAITDEAYQATQQTPAIQDQMKAGAGAMAVGKMLGLSDEEQNTLKMEAAKGTLDAGDFGQFEVQKYDDERDGNKWTRIDKKDGHFTAKMGEQARNMHKMSWKILQSDGQDLDNLAALNKQSGGALLENMEGQLSELEKAKTAGKTRVQSGFDDKGNEAFIYLDEQSGHLKEMKDAIEKLRAATEGKADTTNSVQRMKVEYMEVVKVDQR